MNNDGFFQQIAATHDNAAEIEQRNQKARAAIFAQLFPKQQNVITDPYRTKSLLCPRRSGKTHTAISAALMKCLEKPDANVVIITLTLGTAKKLYWKAILQFDTQYDLGLQDDNRKGGVHATNGTATFDNGSSIHLVGAQKVAEIEKLRGGSYDLVIIDECKSFSPYVLRELIDDVLDPALMDRRGTLLLIGTPGSILAGPFFEATSPTFKNDANDPITRSYDDPGPFWTEKERRRWPQWSFHSFNQSHNIHCPELWEDALKKKYTKRWKDDHPTWVREYLGKWVNSGDEMVYAYARLLSDDVGQQCRAHFYPDYDSEATNKHGLPTAHEWKYILGIDMGFEDDTAIVVCAYSETLRAMFLVYEFKKTHMRPNEIGQRLQQLQRDFDGKIEVMIADTGNLAKMLVADLNERFDLYLKPAEKKNKLDYIELFNADLHSGLIKFRAESELAKEMLELTWDLRDSTKEQMARAGKLKETRNKPNHLCDAILYAWRYCHHYWAIEASPEEELSETEKFLAWDDECAEKASLAKMSSSDTPWYENDPLSQKDWDPQFDMDWLL